ncbi:hydrogenase maturation protease [Thioalkalivibrio paradoxus]|uniref:Nitrogen fixation protein n=1 Tax=Thioalkalivibrio paradoxus ARh 1 TaxID=713585 RepID=W0DLT9_9GAMM|nr:hydrogenase maturation protease [Thioalkalivibrio paradoxus]AHE97963.1 nitrogen fixation protein [Thioalkalivibrio paradoxus ARh 1]
MGRSSGTMPVRPPAQRWRILGVGSPAAGDDLGWAAIERLRDAGLDRRAELEALDRPGPALIDRFEPSTNVILIDAIQAGLPPGSVRELSVDEVIARARVASTHDLGLAETLLLARALGVLPARLHLIGIEAGAANGDRGWRAKALRDVLDRVRVLLF